MFEQIELVDRSRSIGELGSDHVLFFFYRSTARTAMPSRRSWRPSRRATASRWSPSASMAVRCRFPRDARADNGIATTLKVARFRFSGPALHRKITPIGFGVLSESQLLERIAIVSGPQAEAMLPGDAATS